MQLTPALAGLKCFACATPHDLNALQTVCAACGLPLRVDYTISPATLPLSSLRGRVASLWRYREVLPLLRGEVSLGEGFTPLVQADERTWIKDEAQNPTGSFKARGMTAAVSMARALGARALMAPSAGNAAGALSAYGAAAKLPVVVAMPDDTPRAFVDECRHYGAEVKLVPGTISDAGKWLREHGPPPQSGAFDVSTLREPYRVEGKKTMMYELYEQFDGALPDVVVYPTGGGTGLVGMWKALGELRALGWPMAKTPRLVSVQAAGCQPVVKAFVDGAAKTEAYPSPVTRAWGLRVPSPIGGFLCLRAIRETHGTAIAIDEASIAPAAAAAAAASGVDVCPEGGAAWAAVEELRASGWIAPEAHVVVFNTGTGLKYR